MASLSTKMTLDAALSQFPAEINNVIFGYLDLQQLIECLIVCRQWRDNIPIWNHTQERLLRLSPKQLNNALPSLPYIGSVIRGIHLATLGKQVSFQGIIDNLVALDLPCLDTMNLFGMPVEESSVIVATKAWYQLGTKLRRLWLSLSNPGKVQVDISPLLVCCPCLVHLSLSFSRFHQCSLVYLTQGQHEQLQYLNIDARIQLQSLLPLVQHCPQLCYLRLKWDHSMDIQQILDACPSLKGLSIDTGFMNSLRDPWYKERHMATRSSRTLQELDLRILFGDVYRQTATILFRHYMHHLKKICLDIDGGDWGAHVKQPDMDTLGDHPLPALEEFEYHSNRQAPSEASFVIPLLKKCPNLKRILLDTNVANPIYRALVGLDLPYLQRLSICETDSKMDGLEELLFSIAHTNSPLKSFAFKGNVFNSRVIYQALAQISSLRHIELNDFAWRKRDKICVTRCLRQLRGNGSTTSNLESIVFYNVEGFMTVEAFASLRKIPSLKQVTLHRCGSISEPGLRLLVDRKPPLEFLEIHLSSTTMDGKSLQPTLTYARSKIHRVNATGP